MLKEAGYVCILHDGQVTAEGTPAQLLAASGWFTQFAGQSATEASSS